MELRVLQWPLAEERPLVGTSDELAGWDRVALIAKIYELEDNIHAQFGS
ncbi:hypothetical protein A2U01_0095135 [Trifolium medium]|uniref:Uncharacterized protein n=1 Tax=Trifolium medium TaxID=97028 RepID=A0A392UJZ6_9FABA|nr:hypothetical protein [Trifolium medium]